MLNIRLNADYQKLGNVMQKPIESYVCGLIQAQKVFSIDNIYSVYKKKRKLSIMFRNFSLFKDKHFKLAGYLDSTVTYQ